MMTDSTCFALMLLFLILLPLALWYLFRYIQLPMWVSILPLLASMVMIIALIMKKCFMSMGGPCVAYWAISYFLMQTFGLGLIIATFAVLIHYIPEQLWLWLAIGATLVAIILAEMVATIFPHKVVLKMVFIQLAVIAITAAVSMEHNLGNPLLPWMQTGPTLLVTLLGLIGLFCNLDTAGKCTEVNVMIANVGSPCNQSTTNRKNSLSSLQKKLQGQMDQVDVDESMDNEEEEMNEF